MRGSPQTRTIAESSGYSECLDRLSAGGGTRRPLATYRLQFNSNFRFRDAEQLLDYLDELGVTDVYASPVLRARAGSTHGYDITDHNSINPELGGEDEFRELARKLEARGMGLVLDLVANHVGVNQGDNPWWQDLLQNGQSSEFADYFDIDWSPLKPELTGKILLPVLGGQYGEELEGGNLRLVYREGELAVQYYEKFFPLDPQTYALVLQRKRVTENGDGAAGAKLRNLLAEFAQLPPHNSDDAEAAQTRRERIPELQKRFRALVEGSAGIAEYLQQILQGCNGTPGRSRSFDCLHRILEAQPYRLAHWRVSAEEINYRRFFDINDLVGLRMENPRVFAATHGLIRALLAEHSVTGLRIDHPDGLLNPQQYFTRLQMLYCAAHCAGGEPRARQAENGIEAEFQRTFGRHDWIARRPPLYVIVEKILGAEEALPAEWPVDGTVGYEFANLSTGLLIEQRNERAITNLYRRFSGVTTAPGQILYESKRLIMGTALPSEINVLTHMLAEICSSDRRARDFTVHSLRNAIREIIACFAVYRTYIDERGTVNERDTAIIHQAVARAKRQNQSAPATIFDFIRGVLLLQEPGAGASADARRQRLAFTLKFQQLTGPVMAKGLEDTTFYVYNRFLALNEVGGSLNHFGVSVEEFHRANQQRAENWPHSMLASSTHDTKRSEDVRARLAVISEMPGTWSAEAHRWRRINRSLKQTLADGRLVPDANEEYYLYQTLVGTLPMELITSDASPDAAALAAFKERIQQHMYKAVHEAKVNLSWVNSDPEYVEALKHFIEGLLGAGAKSKRRHVFLQQLARFAAPVAYFGAINSLSQTLLKFFSPGVPDVYQGNEVWDFSLVDPDNRRPVDFAARRAMLADLLQRADSGGYAALAAELLENWRDGRLKMWLTQRSLSFRREHRALCERGGYLPIACSGSKSAHLAAFARVEGEWNETAIIAAPRLAYALMNGNMKPPLGDAWEQTALLLPRAAPDHYVNIFTGGVLKRSAANSLLCRELFAEFPVALLLGR